MRFYLVGIVLLANAASKARASEGRVGYDDLEVHSRNAYHNVMMSCDVDVQLLCFPNEELSFVSMLRFGDPFSDWIADISPTYSSSSIYATAPPPEMLGLDQLPLSNLDVLTLPSSRSSSLRASEPSATTATFFVFEDFASDPFLTIAETETDNRDLMDRPEQPGDNNNNNNNSNNSNNKSGSESIPGKLAHKIRDHGANSLLLPDETAAATKSGAGEESGEIPRLASELQSYETSANSLLLDTAGIGSEQMVARRLTGLEENPKNHRFKVELPFACRNHCLEKAIEQQMVSDQCANSVWLLEQTFALETESSRRDKEEFAYELLLFSSGISLVVLLILVARFVSSKRPSLRQRKLDQKVVAAVINNPSIRKQVELQISQSIGHYDLVNSRGGLSENGEVVERKKTIVVLNNNNNNDLGEGLLAPKQKISRKYVPPQIV